MATSPTQLTLKKLRNDGYNTVQVCEYYNFFAKVRVDLFNFIDVLAISDDGEVLAVQCTSKSNISSRINKIANNKNIGAIRKAGWRVEVWGWFKNKSKRWECKIEDVS